MVGDSTEADNGDLDNGDFVDTDRGDLPEPWKGDLLEPANGALLPPEIDSAFLRPENPSEGGRKKDGVDLFGRCVGAECAGEGGTSMYVYEGERWFDDRASTSPESDAEARWSK